MIVNKEKKFIFLHSRKTAGSSITAYLNNYLGPKCIQTGAWVESLNLGGKINEYQSRLLNKNPWAYFDGLLRIYNLTKSPQQAHISAISGALKKIHKNMYGKNPQHLAASAVKELFPREFNFFKFSVVRNPIDFEISDYFFKTKRFKFNNISFYDFLNLKIQNSKQKYFINPLLLRKRTVIEYPKTNWEIISIDNKLVCDKHINFDNLAEEFNEVLSYLGIEKNKIPHSKLGRYTEKPSINRKEKELIYKLHSKEIDSFNLQMNWKL